MKFLLFPFIMMTVLSITGCSNADWAGLIEPRKHKPVAQQKPRPVIKLQPQRRVVYVPPKTKRVPARNSRRTPDCSYIVRDLSRPNSSTVWCHPGGTH